MSKTIAEGTEYLIILNDSVYCAAVADEDTSVEMLIDGYTMHFLCEGQKSPVVTVKVVS